MMPPKPHLIIAAESGVYCLPLVDGTCWTIGRDKTSAVVLEDARTSRDHAMLQCLDTGDFCLSDLGSRNGSFVNGQRVTASVTLQDGDRLTFGPIEVEFHCAPIVAAATDSTSIVATTTDSAPIVTATTDSAACLQKTVLMTSSECQGEIWYTALTSQGLAVIWESADTDLAQTIAQIKAAGPLPDLLLIDIVEIVEHNHNPYAFCRWCHEHYPDLKIILTSGTRTEISLAERKWAIHQGAADLLPGFQQKTLLVGMAAVASGVSRVLEVLAWEPLQQETLHSVLHPLHRLINHAKT